jgi:hypothetical protein
MRLVLPWVLAVMAIGAGRWRGGEAEPSRLRPAEEISDAPSQDATGHGTPGQVTLAHQTWQAFFEGCTRDNADTEYLCGCAATYALDKCARDASGDGSGLATCIQTMSTDEAVRACSAYGALVNAGNVPTPPPMVEGARVPGAASVPQVDRWNGSFRGCMGAATPAERARAPSLHYSCACLATFIVNTCAPDDATSNAHVQSCVDVIGNDRLNGVFLTCDAYGGLRVR